MNRFREWLIPELLREPDSLRRIKVYEAATDWRLLRSTRLGAVCVFVLAMQFTRKLRSGLFVPLEVLLTVGGAFLILAICELLSLQVLRPQIRRRARTALSAQGVPICIRCGYDLTSNASGTCPECGAPVAKGHAVAP